MLKRVKNKILADTTANMKSIHGIEHWKRVERNGLYLARFVEANVRVVRLFAYFHDCMRLNDGYDRKHGKRAAEYVIKIRDEYLEDLSDEEVETLVYACRWHTEGNAILNDTTAVCWDADRLDFGRIGIDPHPKYLTTEEAKRIAINLDYRCLPQVR